MNTDKKVRRYANDLYIANKDMLAVYDAQCDEVVKADELLKDAFNNSYVLTSDMQGVEQWEDLFYLLHDPALDLDLRKTIIINKLLQQPPFTKIWLHQYLASLFGEDKIAILIEYNEYYLYVEVETTDKVQFNNTMEELRKLIPANMAFDHVRLEKYMHLYLKRHYTHRQMRGYTHRELSKYAKGFMDDLEHLQQYTHEYLERYTQYELSKYALYLLDSTNDIKNVWYTRRKK